jgi:hypothetical protein
MKPQSGKTIGQTKTRNDLKNDGKDHPESQNTAVTNM